MLYGVVMTADSLDGIPAVSVTIKGSGRGTITNDQGVFSIVALKGNIALAVKYPETAKPAVHNSIFGLN